MELLKSNPKVVEKVFIARKTHLPSELLSLLENVSFPVVHVEKEKIDRMLGIGKNHQGIVAVIREFELTDPSEILEEAKRNRGVVLVLDEVQDPQNLGNIIRSAEAFGVSGVIIPAMRATGFTDIVVKSSAGSIFHIRTGVVKNLSNLVRSAKESGFWIYSLEVGGKDLFEAVYNFPMILVAGGEDKGVGQNILKASDMVVTIPMSGRVGSINVASSVAIALSWIMKVRSKK